MTHFLIGVVQNCSAVPHLKMTQLFYSGNIENSGIYQQPQNIVGCFCAEHNVPLLFRFVPQKVKIWN